MNQSRDMGQALLRAFELLRMQQESLFNARLAAAAAIEALKEVSPNFAAIYERYYWELKQGELGAENSVALRIIEDIKRQLSEGVAPGA